MQPLRKLLVYAFVLLIFAGSAGVNVFEHFCSIDGADYGYMLPPDHACETGRVQESCCHDPGKKKDRDEPSIRNNCCKEQVKTYRIASDFSQKSFPGIVWEFVVSKPAPDLVCVELLPEREAPSIGFEKRPPPRSGRDILISNQVFRI